jgi:hypothetical protein
MMVGNEGRDRGKRTTAEDHHTDEVNERYTTRQKNDGRAGCTSTTANNHDRYPRPRIRYKDGKTEENHSGRSR